MQRNSTADDVYEGAFRNRRSYFLGDLLGQAKLELGDFDGAKAVYATTLDLIRKLDDQNIWTDATAATAAIVAGDRAAAFEGVRAIEKFNPSHKNLESIERGLLRLRDGLGPPAAEVEELQSALAPI